MKNGLRARYGAADLNQDELTEAVDVTRQTISAIKRERYDPSFELAFKLAACFNYRVENLFDPELDVDLAA